MSSGAGLRWRTPRRFSFPALITGFLFAALLAAIMSTVSNQLLVSSSSLAEDFYKLFVNRQASDSAIVPVGRIAVVAVGAVAALIAGDPESQVLGLVSSAWAGFGAAFGPLMILSLTWPRMTGLGAVAGLVVGAVSVIVRIALGWSSFLGRPGDFEMIPASLWPWSPSLSSAWAARPEASSGQGLQGDRS
jgi:solute:Na+ symporter, SSS family